VLVTLHTELPDTGWLVHACTCQSASQAQSQRVTVSNCVGYEGFSEAMQLGHNLQRCVPLERWDGDSLYDPEGGTGHAYTRFGAFADDVDLHDAAFFRHSRTEAMSTDPQTRLLLRVNHLLGALSACLCSPRKVCAWSS
jgi:acyl transferase domain-containing protein